MFEFKNSKDQYYRIPQNLEVLSDILDLHNIYKY
jgi:hypothetical protein